MATNIDGNEPDDSSQLNNDDSDDSPLTQATAGNTDMGSLHTENHQRYLDASAEMSRLEKQYSNLSGQNADAYSQQKKSLQEATERLNALNFGPSPEEAHLRSLAALAQPAGSGNGGPNLAGYNAERAQIMKEQREAELQKQQLMSQYGMQIPNLTIQANNQQMNQNLGMQRVLGSQVNNSAMAAERGNQALPWYVKSDGNGGYYLPPGAEKVLDQQAMAKLFGRFTLVPQADGSKRIVSGAAIAQQAGGQQPQAPQAPSAPTVPGPGQTNTSAPRAPAPNATGGVTPQFLAGLFQPSNILPAKYGALTQDTKPAYVQAGIEAFSPQEFSQYVFKPDWLTNNKASMVKEIENKDKELGATGTSAATTINNYGHALQAIDGLQNDPKLMTGPFGEKKAAFENALRGIIGDDATAAITADPQLNALAAKQDSDKYFRQAATAGLQAVYHGRITNQELSTQLSSLPSANLMPEVARLLAKAQTDVAQDNVNKAKLWPIYKAKGGNPSMYDSWYDSHFSPFSTDSTLTKTLKAAQAAKAAPPQQQQQNPLVQYYTALAAWKANGSQGPAPQKPQ